MEVFALITAFCFLSASIGLAAENNNLAWMSLLLANRMIASSSVKEEVITIDESSATDIVATNTDSSGETELQVSGDLAGLTQAGSLLYILPGSDDRFPFGVTGRVTGITNNGDGTKNVILEKITYADIFKEAKFDLSDIPLDANNFIGVIAPSGVQAASVEPRIAKMALGGEIYSFRDGAIEVRASNKIYRQLSTTKDGTINAGTVSLNMAVELAKMGDGVENNTMSPVGVNGSVGFVITGALDNIKLTNKHEFSLAKGLESADLRVDGDFNFDVKFNGGGAVKFGYFSQAWKEVEDVSFSTLGVSAKLTGLSSGDKIGKYPLAGLVWSVPCPNTCPVITGSTQTPLRQAKAMGVIVWLYLTLEGEFSLEGELSLARLNPADLSLGIKKPAGGDFEIIRSLERKSASNRLIEAPHLNGTFGAQLKAGITTDLDFFVSGVRIANAGLDVVALTKMELTGDLSYGTDSLNSPWDWEGDACFRNSIGAGAIARASASLGVEIDTSWKDVSLSMEYGIQIPTDEEMDEAGWHGAWFTVLGEDICVGTGGPLPECSTTFLNLCSTDATCSTVGGYWYNDKCNHTPSISTIVYEEDFSTNPSFTSLASTYAYWNSAEGYYYVRTRDDLNYKYWAYSPNLGLVDTSKPTLIELDVMFEYQDWGTYPGIRFYSEEPTEINAQESFRISNAYADGVYKKIQIYDVTGRNSNLTPTISDDVWYHISINLNGDMTANIQVTNKSNGSVIFSKDNTPFKPDSFRYIGIGYYNQPNYGDSWSPIRLDNVKIAQ